VAAPRSFVIKTYGCQMNEHDSERLAGLLVEDGMVPADSVETADLVVLNTCCIRENADNRLYGHLGDLKALREQKPNLQIAVGGHVPRARSSRSSTRPSRRRQGTRLPRSPRCATCPGPRG
jgi:tRNA-2-methylthio-N6-dimethylallyladenosine synthase